MATKALMLWSPGKNFGEILRNVDFFVPTMPPPTEEAARALPVDVPHMSKEEGEKRIVWFHNESAYNTTEDTPMLWGEKGKLPIKPKGKGSSIMVSEFIEENDGYLALSNEQF